MLMSLVVFLMEIHNSTKPLNEWYYYELLFILCLYCFIF